MLDATLIIPQHNQFQLTTATLSTLLHWHQSLPEILLIDDHSQPQHIKRFRKSLPSSVQWFHSPKRGLTNAWRFGASLASQSSLLFLNNDVITTGPWIPELVTAIENASHTIHGIHFRNQKIQHLTTKVLQGWCFGLSKTLYSQLNGFDSQFQLYYSDTDLQFQHLLTTNTQQPLIAHSHLPLLHLAHKTTQHCPHRHQLHQADRRRFLTKWAPHD